jgi:hypothetical protein
MGFIAAADPVSKVAYVFTDIGQLHDAIKTRGYIPVRPDNTAYRVQEFEGGYLLDGAPLNVYIQDRWFDGQTELLQPYWESGAIPQPPLDVLNRQTIEMPEEDATRWAEYQESQNVLGLPTPLLLGIAAVGALLFLRR